MCSTDTGALTPPPSSSPPSPSLSQKETRQLLEDLTAIQPKPCGKTEDSSKVGLILKADEQCADLCDDLIQRLPQVCAEVCAEVGRQHVSHAPERCFTVEEGPEVLTRISYNAHRNFFLRILCIPQEEFDFQCFGGGGGMEPASEHRGGGGGGSIDRAIDQSPAEVPKHLFEGGFQWSVVFCPLHSRQVMFFLDPP